MIEIVYLDQTVAIGVRSTVTTYGCGVTGEDWVLGNIIGILREVEVR